MNSKKRANIKKYAQHIKPKVQIGAAELHDNVYVTVRETFNNEEVIKVKVNRQDKNDKKIVRGIATMIEENVEGVQVVDVIGTTIILYKMHNAPEKRKDFEI